MLTGCKKGQDSSWPPSSESNVWHTDKSFSARDERDVFFFDLTFEAGAGSGVAGPTDSSFASCCGISCDSSTGVSSVGASASGESGVGELLVVVVGPVPDLVGVVPVLAAGNNSVSPVRTSSSSSLILHCRLGRLNFFFGAFPLHPGQCHLPRGVCKSMNEEREEGERNRTLELERSLCEFVKWV